MKNTYFKLEQPNKLTSIDLMPGLELGFKIHVVIVSRVRSSSAARGQGWVKQLLKELCDDADKEQITLVLEVVPEDSSISYDRLEKLYESFGFKWTSYGIMKRRPQ